MFHDRMVSHPNSAEIKSGAFAVLGRLLLISSGSRDLGRQTSLTGYTDIGFCILIAQLSPGTADL